MRFSRFAARLGIAIAAALVSLPPAAATHNDQGTVKVHDNADENPDVRNVPHVSCDVYVEGFKMGDDSGWIKFFAWPPTGEKTEVTPTGDDLNWSADSGAASGEYHFTKGAYYLPAGHYRVEVYTTDGHPGSDAGHFAKAKTFWVEPCEAPVVNPPCPPGVMATASSTAGVAQILIDWQPVANADAYVVYRATGGADFEWMATVTDDTSWADTQVVAGTTYEYYVTAVVDGIESEECAIIQATAVPFFGGGPLLGALAVVGGVVAYAALRRK